MMVMYTNSLTKNSNSLDTVGVALKSTDTLTAGKIKAKDVAYLGVMVALLEIAKVALAVIPNVELVSLLLIVFTRVMGRKTYLVTLGYAVIECLMWGMGTWVIMYLYVWPILVLAIRILDRLHIESSFAYSVVSGAFGLLFGAFSSLTYVAIGGWSMGMSWWISGIPFDLIHGVSNFVICLILYKPLNKITGQVIKQ